MLRRNHFCWLVFRSHFFLSVLRVGIAVVQMFLVSMGLYLPCLVKLQGKMQKNIYKCEAAGEI